MSATTELLIRNEDDAWQALKDAIDGKIPSDLFDIKFENWPTIDIKLVGENFNSSITPRVMEGFLELQKIINQAFASFRYNTHNARLLTDEDKKALEIIVRVSPGSSQLVAILQSAVETFVKGAVNKMDAKNIVITILGAGLLWTGNSCWNSYLENQREIKQIEVQSFAGEQETQRMKILADALTTQPNLKTVQQDATAMYNAVLKATSTAEKVSIAGNEISHDTVKQLVKKDRAKSNEVQLNGVFRITAVGNAITDSYKVDVSNDQGLNFTAKLSDAMITVGDNKQILQDALFDRRPVYLMVNARDRHGEIANATIVGVDEFEPDLK